GRGPVALPQLVAGIGAEGPEEERAVDRGEPTGIGGARPRIDVLDEHGAGRRPVALPQLVAGAWSIGPEEDGVADPDRVVKVRRRARPRVNVFEERRAGRGPVALPQLVAGLGAEGRE